MFTLSIFASMDDTIECGLQCTHERADASVFFFFLRGWMDFFDDAAMLGMNIL